ncbi:MAG: MATE family efflux transporter [Lachnospiraceae bacterium]|nr:MATE family efflux transporter [Lachnospiraceae bacterium]MCI9150529.1 MATE family efflux transporter [Lachnospiraceae bacterium]
MERKTDLTQGNITKGFLAFMVPIILGNVFTQLYNMVDSVIVGQFVGGDALAAVGASFSLTMMINAFLISVGAGATVVVSQYYGARQKENVDKTVNSALLLAGLVAVGITILGMLAARPVLTLMHTPENIFQDALDYFYIIILGTVGHLYYQMTSSVLRGMGDSVWPLGLLIFCSLFNIGADLLFVVVFQMGVCGAAWATILSQLISAVVVVLRLCGRKYQITVNRSTLRIHGELAKSILMIGIPAGLQQLVMSAGGSVVQVFTNSFGSNVVAANSTIIKVDGFIILPLMAIGTAISTFVGQNIGAGKPERLKKGVGLSLWMSVGISVILGLLLAGIAPYAIMLFTDEEAIIGIGVIGLRTLGFFYVFQALNNCITGIVRGAGASGVPMLCAFLNMGVRILLSFLLAYRAGNYRGLYEAMIIGNGCNAAALLLYYKFGNWRNASVVAAEGRMPEEDS